MPVKEHLWFWLLMACLAAILMLGLFEFLDPAGVVRPNSLKNAILTMIADGMTLAYALLCGSMTLAGECGSRTLDTLPRQRIRQWGIKLLFATILTMAQALYVAGFAASVGAGRVLFIQPQTRSIYELAGGVFVTLPAMALPALAWGILGSVLCRRVVLAVAVSATLFVPVCMVTAFVWDRGEPTTWSPETRMLLLSAGLTLFPLCVCGFILWRRGLLQQDLKGGRLMAPGPLKKS